MECKKCGKEITLNDGMVYCPYCGVKLKGQDAPKRRSIFTRELKIGYGVKALIVWVLLCVILLVLYSRFYNSVWEIIWYRFGWEIQGLFGWMVISMICGIALYFTLAYVVYNHAKKHHRRAVAWTTAFIVFTPILGGLVYLLTWPKE